MRYQNVVALEEHRKPPALTSCDFRLRVNGGSRRLVMTLYNDAGSIAGVLSWNLESTPPDFDLSALDAAWALWRETEEVVA